MEKDNILLNNLEKIHTTVLGIERIKNNLNIECDVVDYCKRQILKLQCKIYRRGKNWYCEVDDVRFTINAKSYTIITAHQIK